MKKGFSGRSGCDLLQTIVDSARAIIVGGYLSDSVIGNVINRNPQCPAIHVKREEGMKNGILGAISTASGITVFRACDARSNAAGCDED